MRNQDPYLDQPMMNWIKGFVRQNHWRVASWISEEDLEQDGLECYLKCRNAYITAEPPEKYKGNPDYPILCETPTENQRKWFMELVKRAFFNRVMNLSSRHSQGREMALPMTAPGEEPCLERLLPVQEEEASVLTALANAPTELADVVQRIVQDGLDGGAYLWGKVRTEEGRAKKGRRGTRETTTQYWERVLGRPGVPEALTELLS